jgi:hypothetical protein
MLAEATQKLNKGHHEGFDWDALTRGQVLGSLAIGYFTTQIIGHN